MFNWIVALSTVKSFKLLPNAIPLMVEFASVPFGMFAKFTVIVSLPTLPDIVNPVPADPVIKLKLEVGELAKSSTPLIDAVA